MTVLRDATTLLRSSKGDPTVLKHMFGVAGRRVRSDIKAVGLKRDLEAAHTAPQALIPIQVRPIRDADVPYVLEQVESLTIAEKWDRNQRLRLLEAGVGTCYVAVTNDDVPCYVQWLFSSKDNEFLLSHFQGAFPALDAETALLEGAYTPTAFRGQRIMSAAMSLIAEQARTVGARYVITFVGEENTASLKGCYRSGFATYVERHIRWRMLRPSVTFRPVTPEPQAAA